MIRSPDELIGFLDRWQARKIVVAGDFMLDHYVYGNAERLSPDAPVPVLAVEREEIKPGGASNVALDLAALKCEVACLGVIGKDGRGRQLCEELQKVGCETEGLIVAEDRPTTVKQNLVGLAQHRHPQKMFRVDQESRKPVPAAVGKKLLATAKKLLRGAAALCLEDYSKGVLTPEVCQGLIRLARERGIPVLVDPAAIADYGKYRGVTTITPNRTEASLATGINGAKGDEATLHALAAKLLKDLQLETVVLTLDKQGALLQEKGGRPVLVPTVARQVYDVTGAGDMVLAMLAGAVANGADWLTAVGLANAAAGLEVEKFGIVPVPLEEVMLFLMHQRQATLGKRRTLEQLLPELAAQRKAGKKVVFTNGCFDILHVGHVRYLRAARQAGDLLVVGLNSDASVRRIKGPGRPVMCEDDRATVLSELQSVDYVVVFAGDTPMKLIRGIKPEVLVKGGEYKPAQVVGRDWVEEHGGKVVLVPMVEGRSTSNVISKIKVTEEDPSKRRKW